MKRLPAIIVTLLVCAATASAQLPRSSAAGREGGRTTLDEMVQSERRFAARALVVGWKQAFLEYFADDAVGFDGDQAAPAKDLFRKLPDPPKDRRLIWEPRYGDIALSGDLGYLTGPVRRIVPGQNNGQPFHSIYASVWKRQADGSFKVVMDMGVPTPGPVMFAEGFTAAREHLRSVSRPEYQVELRRSALRQFRLNIRSGEHELKARLGMLLAGRESELMTFGNTTSGASDDLKRASELAIEMVSSMGFSSEFGLLSLQGVPEGLIGPHIQERALGEARALLERAQAECRAVLERHRDVVEALTAALLKDETVSGALLREWLPPAEVAEIGHGRHLKAATSTRDAPAHAAEPGHGEVV